MQDKYYLPQTLDEPFRLILLTIDELLMVTLPIIGIGLFLNMMVLGWVIGFGGLITLKKIKGEQGHYYLVNLIYWYLPPIVRFKKTPPSYIRHYIG